MAVSPPSGSGDGRCDPRRTLEALVGVPFTEGNSVDVLPNGDSFFPAVLRAIRGSTRSVDMLWFLWGTGDITTEVAEALAERAGAGVRVRLLLDGFGARGIDGSLVELLRRSDCLVEFYRPLLSPRLTVLNMRTHRRALVCDETVAFTGGHGIDTAWTGHGSTPQHWRDTGYRVSGPAVEGIRSTFAAAWVQTPHALLTGTDTFPSPSHTGTAAIQVLRVQSQPGWNEAALAIELLVSCARHRVRVATPYARIPHRLVERMAAAVRRGVQVQLMVPGPHVDRAVAHLQEQHGYQALLDAGIEIWHFGPTMLHSKVITVDGRFAMVGTTNLDTRSLALNEQVVMVIDHPATVSTLDELYDADLLNSRRLGQEEWQRRGRGQRAIESVASAVGYPLRGLGALGLTGRRP